MNAASKDPRGTADLPASPDASSPEVEMPTSPIRIGLWRAERDSYGFLDAVLGRLPDRYTVHEFHTFRAMAEDQAHADLDQIDLAWFEWTERRKLHLSEFVGAVPMICRMHPEVAYGRGTKEVRWADVDQWVFPAPGLAQAFTTNHRDEIDGVVVPTGIDVDRIPFDAEKAPDKNIALFGPIHPEDNVALLFRVMEGLVAKDDGFHLHITGAALDEAVIPYLVRQVEQRGLEDHVHFYGVITEEERASWLDQCSYVLSTRPLERDWTGVFEAMARGLKPVIHRFPGAAQEFAPSMLFDTADEAVERFLDGTFVPAEYRSFVEARYDIGDVAAQYTRLLDRVASEAYPERMAGFFAAERARRVENGSAKPADERLEEVRKHLQAEDRNAAADAVEQVDFAALEEAPRLEARVLAIELALEQQRYTDALFHADAAMDLAPEEPMVVHLAGQALWLQGDPQAGADALVHSAELLMRAEEEGGDDLRFAMDAAEAYLVAAEICEQYEQYDAARTFLEKANQHAPNDDDIMAMMERVNAGNSIIERPIAN